MKKIFVIPDNNNFLEIFRDTFFNSDSSDYSDTAVVFPNRRPFLYLNSLLAKRVKKSFFPPEEFTINDFISYIFRKKHPDFRQVNMLDGVWLIYEVIRESNIVLWEKDSGSLDFNTFFPWGKKIYSFINQADTEDIDDKQLKNVKENADIGFDIPEEINLLLSKIIDIRHKFHEKLKSKKLFTRGFIYITALKIIEEISETLFNRFDKIFFAGLFALTNVEKKIIKILLKMDKADIIWNGFPEKWPEILKPLIKYFDGEIEVINGKTDKEPNIKLYSAFDSHSEICKLYDILKDYKIENTVIVLPNSDTLFPLLTFTIENLQRNGIIKNFNISIGYPLNRTSLFFLLRLIIDLQKNIRFKDNKEYYNSRLYSAFLSHPFIKNLEIENIRSISNYINMAFKGELKNTGLAGLSSFALEDIEKNNRLLKKITEVTENDIETIRSVIIFIHDFFIRTFKKLNLLSEICTHFENIIDYIFNKSPAKSYILSGEVFNLLFKLLDEIKKTELAQQKFDNKKLVLNLFFNYLNSQSIPFGTRPLQELEIIGMLETRNLNFKNVIILDMQEGLMPAQKKIDPLIPVSIHEMLGLPGHKKFEEMYRYYFYRLINSAENVHLFYIQNEEKQRSRYIEQIIWDHEKKNKKLDVLPAEKISFPINLLKGREKELIIEKNKIIVQALKEFVYSPTSVDTYLNCRLQFYFERVLRLRETGIITGDIEPIDRGELIHRILNNTMLPFKNRILNKDILPEIMTVFNKVIIEVFSEKPLTGEYYLLKKITEFKLANFLKNNIGTSDTFKIIHLEQGFHAEFNTEKNKVKIFGKIDRIDSYNDNYIIIDYKTGSTVKTGKINLNIDFNNIQDIRDNIQSFQLPLYIYLFKQNSSDIDIEKINAKLIFLTSGSEKYLFTSKTNYSRNDIYNNFYIKSLKTVIDEITNPEIPFKKYDNTDCSKCKFRGRCLTF